MNLLHGRPWGWTLLSFLNFSPTLQCKYGPIIKAVLRWEFIENKKVRKRKNTISTKKAIKKKRKKKENALSTKTAIKKKKTFTFLFSF